MLELSCRFQGAKIRLALPDDATLQDLHEAVCLQTEIEPAGQKLLLNGTRLEPPGGGLEPSECSLVALGVICNGKLPHRHGCLPGSLQLPVGLVNGREAEPEQARIVSPQPQHLHPSLALAPLRHKPRRL